MPFLTILKSAKTISNVTVSIIFTITHLLFKAFSYFKLGHVMALHQSWRHLRYRVIFYTLCIDTSQKLEHYGTKLRETVALNRGILTVLCLLLRR